MKATILEVYRAYNVAMAGRDLETLADLLAPTFTLTHMTGVVQPKSVWLAEQQAGTMRYFSSVEDDVTAAEVTDGWQVIGKNRVVASIHGGGKSTWPLQTKLLIQRVAGRWQIMSAVVTMS